MALTLNIESRQLSERVTEALELEENCLTIRELMPVLGLGERVRLEGHSVIVEGTLSRYRVHLGSGNIYLEPSGRYLCIVPDRRQPPRLHLPFEEEGLKTAEVLSKVLLLGDDASIKDPTILAQIPRRRGPH